MPSYVDLLEFCAAAGVAFHLVGSVGRFAVAVPENRTRRGVWTSGYMRQKYVQYELLQKFFARGLGQGSKRVRNSQLQRLISRPFSTRFG